MEIDAKKITFWNIHHHGVEGNVMRVKFTKAVDGKHAERENVIKHIIDVC
jgi:hypothetical protein